MSKKLLLADDSVTIQRVIELTFSGEDIQVVAVGDGDEAIARLSVDRPDIILADISMPKRSGYEVSSFVKGHPEFAAIPVLLLAGAFEPVDDEQARKAGCDGVLVKPFEPQQVIARVRELIGGGKSGPVQTGVREAPRPSERLSHSHPRPAALPRRDDRASVVDALVDLEDTDLRLRAEVGEAVQDPVVPPSLDDGTLDEYFDKLDEAFGGFDASAAQPPGADNDPDPERGDLPPLPADLEMLDGVGPADDETPTGPAPEPNDEPLPTLEQLLGSMPESHDAPFGAPMTFDPLPAFGIRERPSPSLMSSPAMTASQPADSINLDALDAFDPVGAPATEPVAPAPLAPAPLAPAPPAPPAHAAVVPAEPAPPPSGATRPVDPQTPSPSPSSRGVVADAFSALLAFEQGEPGAAAVRLVGAGPEPVLSDALVEELANRVIEKLGAAAADQLSGMVRQVVSDIAERLVREEIERIRTKA